jgi:hypothetical protein
VSEDYPAVEAIAHSKEFSVSSVCDVLQLSRSAYYAWRNSEPSAWEQCDSELVPLARTLFWKHHRRYGARTIASELADLGETCGPRRVARLLKAARREMFLPGVIRRKFIVAFPGASGRGSIGKNIRVELSEPLRPHYVRALQWSRTTRQARVCPAEGPFSSGSDSCRILNLILKP